MAESKQLATLDAVGQGIAGNNTNTNTDTKIKLRWKHQKDMDRGAPPPPRLPAARLSFVNINRPEQLQDTENQQRIRRHVMQDIGKSRRRGAHKLAIALRVSSVPPTMTVEPSYLAGVKICVHFRRIMFAMGLSSEGALHLALDDEAVEFSHAAEAINLHHAGGQALEPLRRYTGSLEVIRARMARLSNGDDRVQAIGTAICLAFYDMRVHNFRRWAMHMDGLERIVQCAGGLEAIESFQFLRQALFMADVMGSLVFDAHPRFSRPMTRLLQVSGPPPVQGATDRKQQGASALDGLNGILRSLSQLATLISQVPQNAVHGAMGLAHAIFTLAHDLLAVPRSATLEDGASPRELRRAATMEVVRQAALAWVSCVLTTSSGDGLYCYKHRRGRMRTALLQTQSADWAGMEDLKLWSLVIGTMAEDGESRGWLVDRVVQQMRVCGVSCWEDLTPLLRQVAWSDYLHTRETAAIKADIYRGLNDDRLATYQ